MKGKKSPIEVRFWEYVHKGNSCWTWTGHCVKGYGQLDHSPSHRVSWEVHYGKIPHGLFVLHGCDNPKCVCPEHLFLGTQLDNMRDRNKKGRANYRLGEKNSRAKLKTSDIVEIRRRYSFRKVTTVELGKEYGVTPGAIRLIVKRINWKHIEQEQNNEPISNSSHL